ncbi:MAG: DNA primase [Thermodesulfobacteriota bacterium]
MSGYIPEDKIAEIRNTADIVDVVSEAVILKKAGKNYLGLCPFHQEKTPSFTVSPDKQMFHCFGCHEGGNVFTFLMKHQGVSFPEAVRMLARRYGIALPREEMSPQQERADSERQRMLSVNALAAEFFQACLAGEEKGKSARAYLAKRGLTREAVEMFRLGYAPAGWDNLMNHLERKHISPRVAEQAGLVVKKQSGGYYDRFRDRIMFPITDVAGRIIAFGGRVMDDSLPKYLNSPETALYNKRRVLYGLESARRKCRETGVVYITEGYMDFLAVYRHGIENVVATLGTAMTVEHVRLLKGYVTKAVMVFDSDEAGIKAARRGIDLFTEEKSIKPFILSLPEGHDPDSYLMKHGADSFLRLAADAQEAMLYVINEAVRKHGLSVDGKLRVISEMEPVLAGIDDDLARSLYVKELAERIGIEERALLDRINKAAVALKAAPAGGDAGQPVGDDGPPPPNTRQDFGSRRYRLERQVVGMMLHAPFLLPEIEQMDILNFFENVTLAALGKIILRQRHDIEQGGVDITALVENEEQRREVTSLLVGDELGFGEWKEDDCRKLLQQFMSICRRQDGGLNARIKSVADNQDDQLLEKLLQVKRKQLQLIKDRIQIIE